MQISDIKALALIGKVDKIDKGTFRFLSNNCPTVVNLFTKFVKFTHNTKTLQGQLNKNIFEIKQNNKIFFPFHKWKMIITVIS